MNLDNVRLNFENVTKSDLEFMMGVLSELPIAVGRDSSDEAVNLHVVFHGDERKIVLKSQSGYSGIENLGGEDYKARFDYDDGDNSTLVIERTVEPLYSVELRIGGEEDEYD